MKAASVVLRMWLLPLLIYLYTAKQVITPLPYRHCVFLPLSRLSFSRINYSLTLRTSAGSLPCSWFSSHSQVHFWRKGSWPAHLWQIHTATTRDTQCRTFQYLVFHKRRLAVNPCLIVPQLKTNTFKVHPVIEKKLGEQYHQHKPSLPSENIDKVENLLWTWQTSIASVLKVHFHLSHWGLAHCSGLAARFLPGWPQTLLNASWACNSLRKI